MEASFLSLMSHLGQVNIVALSSERIVSFISLCAILPLFGRRRASTQEILCEQS